MRVDGDLNDAIWKRAVILGALTATEPVEGASPARSTEVRLAYDADFLYLAWICFDEPENVRARQMDRDANIQYDDVVQFWVDPFDDARSGFWFQVSAGGSRGDALLSDSGTSFNKNWDGIWYGRTRLTRDGWQAEVALPFKTLAFRPDARRWGFNLTRKRVVTGEESRWASPRVAYRFFDLTVGGFLVGMEGMQQGRGIDVVPYVKANTGRDNSGSGTDDFSTQGDIGLDVAWRPTPEANLRLTFNTDFAETEVDDRPINLSRFPLFFPEKRDFFLEDAGLFEFGAPSRRGRGRSLVPFFSRTIGRDDEGEAVPILAGAKFTGRLDDWSVGVLDTYVDSYSTDEVDVDEQNLSVARVSRNLGGENSVGAIVTSGSPDSELDASTQGVDFRVGSSQAFGPGHRGSLWGYFLNTTTEGAGGDGNASGLEARVNDATWSHTATARVIDEEFNPELGFVRRVGVEDYSWNTNYTYRAPEGAWLRTYEAGVSTTLTLDRIEREDAWTVPVKWMELEFDSEHEIELQTERLYERIQSPFSLDDLEVQTGEYHMTRHSFDYSTNNRRRWRTELGYEWGDFFDGDLARFSVSPVFVPSKHFLFDIEYQDVVIEIDDQRFHRTVYESNVDFTFTPEISWQNKIQYDTTSKDLGWQSRLHWIVEPGQDLFLVGLMGWNKEDHRGSFRTTTQDFTLKLTYTLRF
ncbi:MAG: carbohydrate binding family 9 domain-containing protein [bacterium]|nr:carbohydrate binding family 9 domain-containing protein [bacterium]